MTDAPLIPNLPPRNGEMKHLRKIIVGILLLVAFAVALVWKSFFPFRNPNELLHVSFDASESYFSTIDNSFCFRYTKNHQFTAHTTHAGSIQQAMGITSGLVADVISFASPMEVERIRRRTGCINEDWRDEFPFRSSPFSSTIVFVVRKGNPNNVRDWEDLLRKDVHTMTPDPNISGAGCYNYLAALIAESRMQDTHPQFAEMLFRRIQIVPMGAKSVQKVFLRDKSCDVLITWESLAIKATCNGAEPEIEIVYPSVTVKAEPVVTLVNCNVEKRYTREAATAYIRYLFSEEGQQFAAVNGWRPQIASAKEDWAWRFKDVDMVSAEAFFGSWEEIWQKHFSRNGTYPKIEQLRQAQKGGSE